MSSEQKAKLRQMMLGTARHTTPHTDAARAKMSAARMGKPSPRKGVRLSAETREKIRAAALGRSLTAETRANIGAGVSRSVRSHMETCIGNCRRYSCYHHFPSPTYIEVLLLRLLSEFPDVESERRFGRYRVDAYVPSLHIAFEADGEIWHDAERDARRDEELFARFALVVVRFSGKELVHMYG